MNSVQLKYLRLRKLRVIGSSVIQSSELVVFANPMILCEKPGRNSFILGLLPVFAWYHFVFGKFMYLEVLHNIHLYIC